MERLEGINDFYAFWVFGFPFPNLVLGCGFWVLGFGFWVLGLGWVVQNLAIAIWRISKLSSYLHIDGLGKKGDETMRMMGMMRR